MTQLFRLRPARRGLLTATALVVMTSLGCAVASEAANLPLHFDTNATASMGKDLRCIVGNATDGDGMNARAWVTVEDAKNHNLRWATPIPLEKNWYQNQATHCLSDGNRVLAVIQSDTMSEAATSQTFVEVATLNAATGRIESLDPVKIPGFHGAASMRVDEGVENFQLVGGKPVVKGQYFALSNRDDVKPFSASPTPAVKVDGGGTKGK